MKEYIDCDVLIVSDGLSGMICAITAVRNGAEVWVVTNGKCGYSSSGFYSKSLPWES